MTLQSGSAFIEFVPKLSGDFGSKLSEETDKEAEKSGESAGSKWGKRFAAAGAVAGAVLAKGFADSLNLDAGTDKVAAQLGLTEGVAEMAGKAASNVYKGAWGDSMESVQEAVAAVGSSLLDMNKAGQPEIEKLTENALDLASAFDIDVNRATASAGILMKTGMAKDAGQAFDLITAGLQGVPSQVREDLLDATDEYSTYFKGMGFSGAAAFSILKDASKGGAIQLDKTGDAIKEISIRATDMSTNTVAAYKTIGLNADLMTKNILAGGDKAGAAFKTIAEKLNAIKDPATRSNTAIALFGTQLEDIGVQNIPSFLTAMAGGSTSMAGFEGATQRMSDTLNGNAKTNLESFKRQALQGLTDFVGGTVIPKFTELTVWIGEKLGPNIDIAKQVIIGAAAAMALAVGIHAATVVAGWIAMGAASTWNAAVMVAGWVATGAAAIASGIETAAIALLYVGDWILMGSVAVFNAALVVGGWIATGVSAVAAGAVTSAQVALQVGKWILLGATSLASAALVAAAWLISMGPIVIVVAAVIALVALIIANWDTISSKTVETWNAVWGSVKDAANWIKDKALEFTDYVTFLFLNFTGPGLLINHFDDIKSAGETSLKWVQDKADDFISFFTGIPGKFSTATDGMFDGLGKSFKANLNWIIGKWNAFELKIPEVDTHIPGVGKVGGFSISTPDIPMFAKGGVARGTFIAGDDGPELITANRASRVESNDRTMQLIAGSGGKEEKHYHYHNEAKLEDPLVDQFKAMERLALPA